MPLTMSAEREAEIRRSMNADYDYGGEEQKSGEGQELLVELDATRDKNAELEMKLEQTSRWSVANERDEVRSQLQTEIEAHKRTHAALAEARQESDERAQKIRDLVPDYMKLWAPLDAVRVLAKEREDLREQLRKSQEVSAALLSALKDLIATFDSDAGGMEDARAAIALAEGKTE